MMETLTPEEQDIPAYPVQNAFTGALRKAAAATDRADYLAL